MKRDAGPAEALCPELEEKRFLAKLEAIAMDFAEKHRLEWEKLKLEDRLGKLVSEHRRTKVELLETKRGFLEAVKEAGLLRSRLEAHLGKGGRGLPQPGKARANGSARGNDLNLDLHLRRGPGARQKENRPGKANPGAPGPGAENLDGAIDFEVNRLLKEELVEVKLEVEALRREKQRADEARGRKATAALEQKQGLEKINIAVNKGGVTRVLPAEKRVRAAERGRPAGAARAARPSRGAGGRSRGLQRGKAERWADQSSACARRWPRRSSSR